MIMRSTLGVGILEPRSTGWSHEKRVDRELYAHRSFLKRKPDVTAIQRWLCFDFLPIGSCKHRLLILRSRLRKVRDHFNDGTGHRLWQRLTDWFRVLCIRCL